MLRVALSEVRGGAVETAAEVPPNHAIFKGSDWPLIEPLTVSGRFSSAGEGKYYWRARFDTTVRIPCRRCLTDVDTKVHQDLQLILSEDEETPEGDGVYLIPPRTQVLDLTDTLREEYLLAQPRFVECRPDCKGLCGRCGANLNDGPCNCAPLADPRWDALRKATQGNTEKG